VDEAWEARGVPELDRADALRTAGRWEEAKAALDRLAAAFPDRPEPYNKLGVLYAERRHLAEAETCFREALARDRHYVPALTNLGNLLLEHGRPTEALAYYTEALAIDPDYPPLHRNLAVAYRRLGDVGAAVRHLRRAEHLAAAQRKGAGRLVPAWSTIGVWWWAVIAMGILLLLVRVLGGVRR
jgi:tetratricopeptide (TPR) repeat protein